MLDFFLFSMFLMVFLSMIGFCLLRSHILLTLLSLEGSNLGLCMIVFSIFPNFICFCYMLFLLCVKEFWDSAYWFSLMHGKGNDYVYGLEFLC